MPVLCHKSSNIFICQDILIEVLTSLAPGRRESGAVISDDDPPTPAYRLENRNALAACARVSKSMSHHALNVLWADLDDLNPVLQFLPVYSRHRSQSPKTIDGAISTASWSRLQSYAIRVRGLTIPCDSSVHWHPSVWPFLAKSCAGAPLFPNLSELDALDLNTEDVAPIMLVLSPSLRDIRISFETEHSNRAVVPSIVGSVLHTLALTAPRLKILSLMGDHSLDGKHLQCLERFTSVQEIALSQSFHVDEAVLHSISKLSTLLILNVGIRLGGEGGERIQTLDFGDSFRQLNTLTLRGKSKDLSDVVIAISPPSLQWLNLEFTDSVSVTTLEAPLTAIASCIPDTVTSYGCHFNAALSPLPDALASLIPQLLLKMPNLEFFDLFSHKSPLSVTNEDLVRLGDAWPKLKHLNIRQWTYKFNQRNVRQPDVSGLAELAKRCPKLGMLCLPELDISKTIEPKVIPFLRHRLKYLLFQSVSTAPTQALHEAAVAIDVLFPRLDLHDMRPMAIGPGTQWMDVWRTLEIMRWGRRNYRLSDSGADSMVPKVSDISRGRAPGSHTQNGEVRS